MGTPTVAGPAGARTTVGAGGAMLPPTTEAGAAIAPRNQIPFSHSGNRDELQDLDRGARRVVVWPWPARWGLSAQVESRTRVRRFRGRSSSMATTSRRGESEVEERFRLLVASVKDYAIIILDPNGNITTWNAGAQRITGHTADEVIGQHCSIFYTADDVV